jgi:uncharacterized cupin superfamily protein
VFRFGGGSGGPGGSGGSGGSAPSAPPAGVPLEASSRAVALDELLPWLDSLPAAQVVSGSPKTGLVTIATLGDVETGLWVHSSGESTDVEADEVSLILEGDATVEFLDGSGEVVETVELAPGVLLALHEGERTRWRVRETLRKLYVAR